MSEGCDYMKAGCSCTFKLQACAWGTCPRCRQVCQKGKQVWQRQLGAMISAVNTSLLQGLYSIQHNLV